MNTPLIIAVDTRHPRRLRNPPEPRATDPVRPVPRDLYYRISEIAVLIPPLRERQGDPSLLAQAAELLGVTRPTRYNLLDTFGLRKANEPDESLPQDGKDRRPSPADKASEGEKRSNGYRLIDTIGVYTEKGFR